MKVQILNHFIAFATAFNIPITAANLRKYKRLEEKLQC